MENKFGNMFVGGIVLLGIIVIFLGIIGGVISFINKDYVGAGILLISSSIPIGIALNRVLKD